jgi:RimJ/RimL family protein N-acetyltransferase
MRTERLVLRPFTAADEAFLQDLHAHDAVMRFIGDGRTHPPAAALGTIARWAALADGVHGVWAVEEAGVLRGAVLLKPLPASGTGDPSGETEIGWRLHPSAQGRGIGSEAAARVLEHAWATGLDRVLAVTHPLNLPSQRLAQRIGMRRLGRTRAYYDVETELFAIDRPA